MIRRCSIEVEIREKLLGVPHRFLNNIRDFKQIPAAIRKARQLLGTLLDDITTGVTSAINLKSE